MKKCYLILLCIFLCTDAFAIDSSGATQKKQEEELNSYFSVLSAYATNWKQTNTLIFHFKELIASLLGKNPPGKTMDPSIELSYNGFDDILDKKIKLVDKVLTNNIAFFTKRIFFLSVALFTIIKITSLTIDSVQKRSSANSRHRKDITEI